MKLIIAIVRPFTLEKLVVAFEDVEGFPGMTVMESAGFGQRNVSRIDALDPFRPNKRIEIACPDDMADQIIGVIREHAHTGRRGDGIVLVMPLDVSIMI